MNKIDEQTPLKTVIYGFYNEAKRQHFDIVFGACPYNKNKNIPIDNPLAKEFVAHTIAVTWGRDGYFPFEGFVTFVTDYETAFKWANVFLSKNL